MEFDIQFESRSANPEFQKNIESPILNIENSTLEFFSTFENSVFEILDCYLISVC